jgi:iron(II)-dependent oxidoreductase
MPDDEGTLEGGSKPCSQKEHESWLADIIHWSMERRIRVGYDGARYDLPALQWTQSSFMQPQMRGQDRYFYDPAAGKHTVDRYLDDLEKRYGGSGPASPDGDLLRRSRLNGISLRRLR